MNLSDDRFQVYKRRDPGTNAFVYSVTDGQNVVELNRDPFPPAAGMNYTQDIINSTKTGADAVSTLPASNLQEAMDLLGLPKPEDSQKNVSRKSLTHLQQDSKPHASTRRKQMLRMRPRSERTPRSLPLTQSAVSTTDWQSVSDAH